MQEITSRRELAEAINIKHLPVVRINWERALGTLAPDSHEGEKVNIVHRGCVSPCRVVYFDDVERFTIMQEPAFLAERFSYEDANEMIENAKAPIVKEGDNIVIVKQWPSKRWARFFIGTVGPINWRAADCGHID